MKNKYEIRGEVTAIFLHRRLTKSTLETLIDTADLPIAMSTRLSWYAWWSPLARTFYARTREGTMLHRVILKCQDGLDVDHRDKNGLNNRRFNLFESTRSKNRLNQGPAQKGTRSGLRGVTRGYKGKWRARVKVDDKEKYLGQFVHKEDASEVVENFLLITLGRQRFRESLK